MKLEKWLPSAKELYSSGRVSFEAKDYKKTLTYFEEVVKRNPNYEYAFLYIGHCNNNLGRFTEEIEAFKQAISIKPDYAKAHYSLEVANFIVGDRKSAFEVYKIFKELDKDLSDKLFNLIYK